MAVDAVFCGIVLVLTVAFSWIWKYFTSTSSVFPPGPRGVPIFGNLLMLREKPAVRLMKLTKKFGDMFTIQMRDGPMVVLNDIAVARRVYSSYDITGRPGNALRLETAELPQDYGLAHSNGEIWKTHRRFTLTTLRSLAINGDWLEGSIQQEVEEFCNYLKESDGKAINIKPNLSMASANVMLAFMIGKRIPVDDKRFRRITDLITQNMAGLWTLPIIRTFPFLRFFPNPVRTIVNRSFVNRLEMVEFVKELIKDGSEKDVPGSTAHDYLHAYLQEKRTGEKLHMQHLFNEPQLIYALLDLLQGGGDTVTMVIIFTFIFMLEEPSVLKKIQREIDVRVGFNRVITSADRPNLPYTDATILEVLRLGTFVPITGQCNAEPVQIGQYTLPRNTLIATNVYGIHRDARYFENPEKFDPKRFIDADGKLIKPDGFAPFGAGKRECPAQSLAKVELFLFVANILSQFSLELPEGKTITRDDYLACGTDFHVPHQFELKFKPRVESISRRSSYAETVGRRGSCDEAEEYRGIL